MYILMLLNGVFCTCQVQLIDMVVYIFHLPISFLSTSSINYAWIYECKQEGGKFILFCLLRASIEHQWAKKGGESCGRVTSEEWRVNFEVVLRRSGRELSNSKSVFIIGFLKGVMHFSSQLFILDNKHYSEKGKWIETTKRQQSVDK